MSQSNEPYTFKRGDPVLHFAGRKEFRGYVILRLERARNNGEPMYLVRFSERENDQQFRVRQSRLQANA